MQRQGVRCVVAYRVAPQGAPTSSAAWQESSACAARVFFSLSWGGESKKPPSGSPRLGGGPHIAEKVLFLSKIVPDIA